MFKKLLFLLLLTLSYYQTHAQKYTGLIGSKYAGSTAISVNPATVVNSNYIFDAQLFGGDYAVVNDYLIFSLDSILNGQGEFFDRFENTNNKSDYVSAKADYEINFLSGMARINDKMSVGFGIKARSMASANNFNRNLIEMSASGLEDSTFYGQSFSDDLSTASIMGWTEYSLSFGAEVLNKDAHYLSVGATAKLTQSLGAFYLKAQDLRYEFYNKDTILNASGEITFGSNVPDLPANVFAFLYSPFNMGYDRNFGLGFDVGAVYEFRPDDEEDYKLKVGLSFVDIGYVGFKNDSAVSNVVTFENSTFDVNFFDGITSLDDINYRVVDEDDEGQFNYERRKEKYSMQLPTAMNLFVDYHIVKGLHATIYSRLSLFNKNNPTKLVGINAISISPRYDINKWFSFSLPVTYTQNAGFGLGYGMKLGVFFMGTNDLVSLFALGNKIKRASAYGGFRIPIHTKEK